MGNAAFSISYKSREGLESTHWKCLGETTKCGSKQAHFRRKQTIARGILRLSPWNPAKTLRIIITEKANSIIHRFVSIGATPKRTVKPVANGYAAVSKEAHRHGKITRTPIRINGTTHAARMGNIGFLTEMNYAQLIVMGSKMENGSRGRCGSTETAARLCGMVTLESIT